jgi:nucleoid-associated protein YgaU
MQVLLFNTHPPTYMEYQMPKLTRIEVNCSTGKETVIELTAEEIAQLESDRLKFEQDKANREAAEADKAAAKSAIAERLGLTAEELATLLS